MPLGGCQCCAGQNCPLNIHSFAIFGGRPGNLNNAPTDTRYLQSKETYREWGVDADGKTYDYTKTILWTYPKYAVHHPTRTVIAQTNTGDTGNYEHPDKLIAYTKTGAYFFPIADAGTVTNEIAIYEYAYSSGGYSYNLRASRVFTQPITWSQLWAKALACHKLHPPSLFVSLNDIQIDGRSLVKHRYLYHYLDSAGAPKSILAPTDEEFSTLCGDADSILSIKGDMADVDYIQTFTAATEPISCYEGNATLEVDNLTGFGLCGVDYPILDIYWSVLPQCPLSDAICPNTVGRVMPCFSNGTPYHIHRFPINLSTSIEGSEEACEDTTPTGSKYLVWDPAPSDTPTTTGHREYPESGSCPA